MCILLYNLCYYLILCRVHRILSQFTHRSLQNRFEIIFGPAVKFLLIYLICHIDSERKSNSRNDHKLYENTVRPRQTTVTDNAMCVCLHFEETLTLDLTQNAPLR